MISRRSITRLAVIQALYQIENQNQITAEVIEEFLNHRKTFPTIDSGIEIEQEFFKEVVEGVMLNLPHIDKEIISRLTEEWNINRIDSVLRAILRAGVFEIIYKLEIPIKVVFNEYIELSKDFFNKTETSFVNGLLHDVANKIRKI